ncbi:hypothetical protein [Flavicella sp.]|uniref:hypothetical protein n=1 Tax=Flavicella sp. TaxID=2957742 RepID=UPI003017305A
MDSIINTTKELRIIPQNFKEDYHGNAYNYEQNPNLGNNFIDWLDSLTQSWLQTRNAFDIPYYVFKIIIGLVICFVIFFLVKMIDNKEGRWIFSRNKTSRKIGHNDIESNITDINFEELIENSIDCENYRLAIRYSYLWILKQLNEKSIIEYHPEKTNIDYQFELENSAYYENFKKASYYYNYIWYGEFFIDKTIYHKAADIFKNFKNQIQHVK